MPDPVGGTNVASASLGARRRRRPELLLEWMQDTGMLLASGNGMEMIRVWDANAELCVLDQPLLRGNAKDTNVPTYVTSLAHSDGGRMLHAGCRDGAVRSFDVRMKTSQSLVGCFSEHQSSIVQVHQPISNPTLMYTASIGGAVYVSDVRFARRTLRELALPGHAAAKASLDCVSGHHYAPLLAAGSHKMLIEIMDTNGSTVDTIRYHIGFLGQRVGPISCLGFHRHKLLLAAGALDSYISIFAGTKEY